VYSWNDLNGHGDRFGSGVVYEERFADAELPSRSRYRRLRARPRRTPPLWNAASVQAINRAYPLRDSLRPDRVRSVHDTAFPINGSEAYFAGFGRRGFREYQMIVPHSCWTDAVAELERAITRSGVPVTLGSLKLFSGAPRLLWFVADGVCVTVDVAAGPRAGELFETLDDIAVDYGARVNVAKDSRLGAATVGKLFDGYDVFRSELERFDPRRRLDTALRQRLEL